jgi:hypothetical protein
MSTVTIPKAPRSMLTEAFGETAASTPSLDQIFAKASEEVYPRLALLEALAPFKDQLKRRPPSGNTIVENRRDFLDSFASLCDVEKGGATVTASGLQRLAHSNILWLAANEGIRNDIKTYADTIRSKLQAVDLDTRLDVENDIFSLAVEKCRSRIMMYKLEMQRHARNCRMQLRSEVQDETGKIPSSYPFILAIFNIYATRAQNH